MTTPAAFNKTDQIKEIIKREYKRCALDPEYFLRKYAVIQHPIKGKIPFSLYNYQADTLRAFIKDENVIILKGRQIGVSTLVGGYALWLMLFHLDKNVLVIATKQETAKNIVTKVRVMHQNLPVWLRGSCIEDNKLSLKFSNGSQIKAISSSPDAGRSEALSLLILDEAAHIDPPDLADDIWTAASSTLATGGKAFILSTPNGMGNFFHRMWQGAKSKENNFTAIGPLDWRVHPDRDNTWRENQTKKMGMLEARQEHDADFIASGHTVIDGDLIQLFRKTYQKDPILKRGFDGNLWVWENTNYSRSYMVIADVSRGDGSDKSAFHVIDLEFATQVAEYKGVIGTKDFAGMLVAIATEYNDALLVIENANAGWAVIQAVIDRPYRNLFYMVEDIHYLDPNKRQNNKLHRQQQKAVAGFTTSVRTRPLIISKLDEYMRDTSVTIQSARTYDELEVFIWNGSKAEAMAGYNDDLVMSLAIGLWVRDTALKLRQQGVEITKATLDNFTRHNYHEAIYTSKDTGPNPFIMPLGPSGLPGVSPENEDIRWLIR